MASLASAARARNPVTEQLRPTPAQERALDEVLWRCRDRSTAAREQRITAWQRRRVWVARFEQEADLQDLRAAFAEDARRHSPIRHDVVARLDQTAHACFRRVQRGEKAGFPRFTGRNRCHAFTFTE